MYCCQTPSNKRGSDETLPKPVAKRRASVSLAPDDEKSSDQALSLEEILAVIVAKGVAFDDAESAKGNPRRKDPPNPKKSADPSTVVTILNAIAMRFLLDNPLTPPDHPQLPAGAIYKVTTVGECCLRDMSNTTICVTHGGVVHENDEPNSLAFLALTVDEVALVRFPRDVNVLGMETLFRDRCEDIFYVDVTGVSFPELNFFDLGHAGGSDRESSFKQLVTFFEPEVARVFGISPEGTARVFAKVIDWLSFQDCNGYLDKHTFSNPFGTEFVASTSEGALRFATIMAKTFSLVLKVSRAAADPDGGYAIDVVDLQAMATPEALGAALGRDMTSYEKGLMKALSAQLSAELAGVPSLLNNSTCGYSTVSRIAQHESSTDQQAELAVQIGVEVEKMKRDFAKIAHARGIYAPAALARAGNPFVVLDKPCDVLGANAAAAAEGLHGPREVLAAIFPLPSGKYQIRLLADGSDYFARFPEGTSTTTSYFSEVATLANAIDLAKLCVPLPAKG